MTTEGYVYSLQQDCIVCPVVEGSWLRAASTCVGGLEVFQPTHHPLVLTSLVWLLLYICSGGQLAGQTGAHTARPAGHPGRCATPIDGRRTGVLVRRGQRRNCDQDTTDLSIVAKHNFSDATFVPSRMHEVVQPKCCKLYWGHA